MTLFSQKSCRKPTAVYKETLTLVCTSLSYQKNKFYMKEIFK